MVLPPWFWCKIGDKSHGRIQSGSKHHYQQTNKCKLNKKFKLMIFPTKTVVIPKISNQKCFTVLSFKFFPTTLRLSGDPLPMAPGRALGHLSTSQTLDGTIRARSGTCGSSGRFHPARYSPKFEMNEMRKCQHLFTGGFRCIYIYIFKYKYLYIHRFICMYVPVDMMKVPIIYRFL